MKLRQKIFMLVIVLVLALTTIGWIAGNMPQVASTYMPSGTAQIGASAEASYTVADFVPFKGVPGISPCVSWNG
jgi:hypothetical protein